jgi:hypothetical protein
MQTVPPHVRRGLLRLYIAVSIPWVLWFGPVAFTAYSYSRRDTAIFALLLVPGVPLLYLIAVWVLAGFQGRPSAKVAESPPRSTADYHSVIARAVSGLADNTPAARQILYDRARMAVAAQLHGQDPPISESHIARERLALEAAIRRIEEEASPRHTTRPPKVHGPASTALLIASILFLRIFWVMDFTCMSLYWVARLPKPR